MGLFHPGPSFLGVGKGFVIWPLGLDVNLFRAFEGNSSFIFF